MTMMINDLFLKIAYSYLMYVIKRRDPEGLIYFSRALVDCVNTESFVDIINTFFISNAENITPDDVNFFDTISNEYIANIDKDKQKKENKLVEDKEIDMKKITKAVALFEKNGLQMGKDYSFYNGKIRMKKECQAKILKLLGK